MMMRKGLCQGLLKNNSGILEVYLMDILRVSIKYPSTYNSKGDFKEYSIARKTKFIRPMNTQIQIMKNV